MQTTVRFLAFVVLGAVVSLAACGGSDLSPASSTTSITSGSSGTLTASGNGPGVPSPGGKGQGPGPGDGSCGTACTGPVGPDPADILTVLGDALQEEYKAEMLYRSVLEDFPGAAPFAVIAESEARHVEALATLFTRRLQTPTGSTWTPSSFPPFASVPLACAAGVAAEQEDAAFYTPYLQRTDLPQDVRNVFTNLQAASLENHLPAFERCR